MLDLDKSTWTRVRFGDVVKNINETAKEPTAAGIHKVIGLEHLDPGELALARYGDVADGTTFTRRVRPGQTLFGKRRAYQRKAAYAEVDAICSGDILAFEADSERLSPRLLPFLVHSDAFLDHALGTSAGSLSPRTSWKALAKYDFDLPPLDEQERIADLLWATEVQSQKVTRLRCALRDAHNAWLNEELTELATHGEAAALNELIDPKRPICYGILMPGDHVAGGVPVVKVRDYPDGQINRTLLHTTHEINSKYKRSMLRQGDLLLSIRGTVGRLAAVPADLEGANITQDTARISVSESYDGNYLLMALSSNYMQHQMRRLTTGLAVKGLNIGSVRKLVVPVPSSRAKEAILVERDNDFRTAADTVDRDLTSVQTLRRSIQADVFGERP